MAKSYPLLREVPFGSFLVYVPRGLSAQSKHAKDLCYGVKQDRPGTVHRIIIRLKVDFAETGLSDFLGPDVALVPVPTSAPLVTGGLWPAKRVAEELVDAKLGREVLPIVLRANAVPKSAFAAPGQRPTPRVHSRLARDQAAARYAPTHHHR